MRIAEEKTPDHRVPAKVVRWISAVGAAVALTLGVVVTQPAAAVPHAAVAVTSVSEPMSTTAAAVRSSFSNPWGVTASKTWAFTQCIFAVGVPAGLVFAIATNPLVWRYVLGFGPQPTIGGSIDRYLSFVKSRCGYALR